MSAPPRAGHVRPWPWRQNNWWHHVARHRGCRQGWHGDISTVPWQAPAKAAVFPELEAPRHAWRGQEQVLGILGQLLTIGGADQLVHVVEAALRGRTMWFKS
jgi:hypothetical protein